MDDTDALVAQLHALADMLDSPDGPGSGAIALDAAAAIEDLRRRMTQRADEPTTT